MRRHLSVEPLPALRRERTADVLGTLALSVTLCAMLTLFLLSLFYGARIRPGQYHVIPRSDLFEVNEITSFLAFVLMLVVFYITKGEAQMLNEKVTIPIGLGSVGAIPVAFTVWVIGLYLGGTTGYAINPARDLAPRFMHTVLPIKDKGDSQWSYSWVPLIGPLLGSTLAAMLYLIL